MKREEKQRSCFNTVRMAKINWDWPILLEKEFEIISTELKFFVFSKNNNFIGSQLSVMTLYFTFESV